MSKSDSSEYQNRVNVVYSMILQGYQRKKVIQYITEKHNVSERQVDNYLQDARKIMSEEQSVSIELKRSEILSQLYDLYQKSIKIDDFRECRNILSQIAGILGVNAPIKTETELRASIKPIEWVKDNVQD